MYTVRPSANGQFDVVFTKTGNVVITWATKDLADWSAKDLNEQFA
jgi:hypothetical protein